MYHSFGYKQKLSKDVEILIKIESILSVLSSLDRASMDPKPSLLVLTNFYMQHNSYLIEIFNILQ